MSKSTGERSFNRHSVSLQRGRKMLPQTSMNLCILQKNLVDSISVFILVTMLKINFIINKNIIFNKF
jgi:hypothetical protein